MRQGFHLTAARSPLTHSVTQLGRVENDLIIFRQTDLLRYMRLMAFSGGKNRGAGTLGCNVD
ncbi:hypothetical protein SBA4_2130005 [Candidatus Sulfopaludibacter sp. SbA4]|nr:hypothetical protein SBA4_2130005 [Candidatus Sulfopaludibacter sp. SbA4]